MKKITLIMLFVAIAATGCNRVTDGSGKTETTTETISPANAQPAPTGTEALTQTTEVEDSRSENEGGTSDDPPPTTTTAKAPPKKKSQ